MFALFYVSTGLCGYETMAAKPAYNESMVRAAVIFGILRFTQWPSERLNGATLNLCALGNSPTSSAIEQLPKIPSVSRLKLNYRQYQRFDELMDCHAIVLGDKATGQALALHNALLICDGCENSFAERSGIRLFKQAKRIHFDINLDRIDEQGLSLSSSLIELASHCYSSNPAFSGCKE